MEFDYYISTRVIFGQEKIEALGRIALPGKKALMCITSGGSLKKYGYLDKVLGLLKQNSVETVIFDGVQPKPNTAGVMQAAALGRKKQVNFVIGFDGGSSIDTAKAAAAAGYPHCADGFLSFLDYLLHQVGLAEIDYTQWGIDPARAGEYAQDSYDVTQGLHDRNVHPMPYQDCVGIIERSLRR